MIGFFIVYAALLYSFAISLTYIYSNYAGQVRESSTKAPEEQAVYFIR